MCTFIKVFFKTNALIQFSYISKLNYSKVINDLCSQCLTKILPKTSNLFSMEGVRKKPAHDTGKWLKTNASYSRNPSMNRELKTVSPAARLVFGSFAKSQNT